MNKIHKLHAVVLGLVIVALFNIFFLYGGESAESAGTLWRTSFFEPNEQPISRDLYGKYTHINLIGLICSNGKLADSGYFNQSTWKQVRDEASAVGTKLLIYLGPWDMSSCTSPATISSFVNEIKNVVMGQHPALNPLGVVFDGVDVDWEHNMNTGNVSLYTDLISRLDAAMPTKLITLDATAIPGGLRNTAIASHTKLDQINLMCYDLNGGNTNSAGQPISFHHSSIGQGTNNAWSCGRQIDIMTAAGVPASKLGFGIPFYGFVYSGCTGPEVVNCTNYSGSQYKYKDIVNNSTFWNGGSNKRWDGVNKAGYLSVGSANQFLTYGDERYVQEVVAFAKQRGLGGVMTWHMGMDYNPNASGNARFPLSTALYNADTGGVAIVPVSPPPPTAPLSPTPVTPPAPITPPATQGVKISLAAPSFLSVERGKTATFTFNWSGGPTNGSKLIFVHFTDSAGNIIFEDANHYPTPLTSSWIYGGYYSETRTITVPATALGTYKVMVGLYDPNSGARQTLATDLGVVQDNEIRYQVATLNVVAAVDTTRPTVSINSPMNASSVSGTVNVTASASDNVGVKGVQFKIDGNNLGAEDMVAPYQASLNTMTVNNGPHTLSAAARDNAGNYGNANPVIINTNNTQPVTIKPLSGPLTSQPGQNVSYTLSFSGGPTNGSKLIFVHFTDALGKIIFEDANHFPTTFTNNWTTGNYSETRTVSLPSTLSGTYKIMAGLYDPNTGVRLPLTPAAGVIPDGEVRYQVGTLSVGSAPTISDVKTPGVYNNMAMVTWSTNQPAKSQVEYGLTPSFGLKTGISSKLRNQHVLVLTNLSANSTYYYRAIATNAGGLTSTSNTLTFTTARDADVNGVAGAIFSGPLNWVNDLAMAFADSVYSIMAVIVSAIKSVF